MFTGLVSAVGRVVEAQPLGAAARHGKRLVVETPAGWLDDAELGDSIALNGACMTVAALDGPHHRFSVDLSAESLAHTAGLDVTGAALNLEKALRATDRLGGHLVSGHVDGVGHVTRFEPAGESWRLALLAPKSLARFLAYKGSITVDGVSLTVNRVTDRDDGAEIEINLIPHTVENTTLGQLEAGTAVNLEVDLIARYVERMVTAR